MSRTPSRRRSSEPDSLRVDEAAARDSGEALAEYAVLVAAVAVACVLAVVFVAVGVGGLLDRSEPSPAPGPLVPPRTPDLSYPTKLADCEHGRWQNYAQFSSEEECKKSLESDTK